MTFGDLIRERRLQLHMTQDEFASRTHISKSFISDIENNKKYPSIPVFDEILKSLNYSHIDFYQRLNTLNDKSVEYYSSHEEKREELSILFASILKDWYLEDLSEILSYIKAKELSKK